MHLSTEHRIKALQAAIDWSSLDAALIANGSNVAYLADFWGHSLGDGWVLVTPEKALLFTDARYVGPAREASCEAVIWGGANRWKTLGEHLPAKGATVGFDRTLPFANVEQLEKKLEGWKLAPLPGSPVEDLRLIKEPAEIERIRSAAAITDAVFEEFLAFVKPGQTELEVMHHVCSRLRQRAETDELAFGVIVASGLNGETAHATPTTKVIEPGDFVTLDMGAKYRGYCSDMTRTVAIGGKALDPAMVEIYEAVLSAQVAGVQAARGGMTNHALDRICRDSLEATGHGEAFAHGTGHGLGLDIHENPRVSVNADTEAPMPAGAVVTIEPGVYKEGVGGVRIEDLVVLAEQGCEVLSRSPKHLITVG